VFIDNELFILKLAIGIILAANVIAMGLFVLFAKLSDSKLETAIHKIIHELDEFADNMANMGKRATAVQKINELLGWQKIFVPSVLIGLIIDAEVSAIRKMQASTDCQED
jgi:hypothetical protein